MPEIYKRYTWNMPNIYLIFARDLSEICLRLAQDVPKICLRFDKDLPKICLRFVWGFPKICLRFARVVPEICLGLEMGLVSFKSTKRIIMSKWVTDEAGLEMLPHLKSSLGTDKRTMTMSLLELLITAKNKNNIYQYILTSSLIA